MGSATGGIGQFSGSDRGLPIELFVELMDAHVIDQDPGKVPDLVKECLSFGIRDLIQADQIDQDWPTMREFLLDTFGHKDRFQIIDCLHLLASLTKKPNESVDSFIIRVKFCVKKVIEISDDLQADTAWTKLLYFHGIGLSIDKVEKDLDELSVEFDNALKVEKAEDCPVEVVVKSEPLDSDLDPEIKQEVDEDPEYEPEDVELKPLRKRRSGRPRKKVKEKKSSEKAPGSRHVSYLDSVNDVNWEDPLIFQVIRDKRKSANTLYVCAICVKQGKRSFIEKRTEFSKHVKDEHNGNIVACDCCDYDANQMERLASHRFMVHKKVTKNFTVRVCPMDGCANEFISKSDMGTHIRYTHYKQYKPGMCPICGVIFKSNTCIPTHIRNVHEGARDHSCDQCDRSFKIATALKRHKIKVHGEGPKAFECVCEVCGKVCPDKVRMQLHVRRDHKKERPHVCSICGRTFFSRSTMKHHERAVHQLGDQFLCPHCGRNLPNAHSLKTHIDLHLNKKKFHCRECDSWFTASHTLALHIAMRHLGFSQVEGKKPEHINAAKQHPAYERVADEHAMIGNPSGRQKVKTHIDKNLDENLN